MICEIAFQQEGACVPSVPLLDSPCHPPMPPEATFGAVATRQRIPGIQSNTKEMTKIKVALCVEAGGESEGFCLKVSNLTLVWGGKQLLCLMGEGGDWPRLLRFNLAPVLGEHKRLISNFIPRLFPPLHPSK